MGVLGALLALPFAAAIQVIVVDALRMRQHRFELAAAQIVQQPAPPGAAPWRAILTQFLSDSDDRKPPDGDDAADRPRPTTKPDAPPESGES
jgi:hypothetical protein